MVRMRRTSFAMAGAGLVLALSACSPKEEEKACCAINPVAKCESNLLAAGVTRAELGAVMTADGVCPADGLAEARIREIAKLIDVSGCPQIDSHIVLSKLERGLCETRPGGAPPALNDTSAPP